jgi:hypothetical protein
MGHLLDLNFAAFLGEELCCRGENPLAVSAGIGPPGPRRLLFGGAQGFSLDNRKLDSVFSWLPEPWFQL